MILDFIFPRVCHLCGETLGAGVHYVCGPCLAKIPRTLYHRIPDNPMEQRFMGQFPFRAGTGHFFYSRGSELAVLMQDLKYRHFRGLARFLGETVAKELLPTGFLSGIDVILPVPMHFWKKARRGYNQTEQIAIGISNITGIPVGNNLKAVRSHRTQTSLSRQQRLKNTEGIFKVFHPEQLPGKGMLLLDDVCTTGATLSSAAIALVDALQAFHSARSRSDEGTEKYIPDISLLTLGVTF